MCLLATDRNHFLSSQLISFLSNNDPFSFYLQGNPTVFLVCLIFCWICVFFLQKTPQLPTLLWAPWPLPQRSHAPCVCSACCWFWRSTFVTTKEVWGPEELEPSTIVCPVRRTPPWTTPSSMLEQLWKTSFTTWPPQALDQVLFCILIS